MTALDAASCSPTAAHRLQSLGVLFAETVSRAAEGKPDASAADLPSLLQEVTDRMPAIAHLEDYCPSRSQIGGAGSLTQSTISDHAWFA